MVTVVLSGAALVKMLKKSSKALVVGSWLAEDREVKLDWQELVVGRREIEGGGAVVEEVGQGWVGLQDADCRVGEYKI